jgi:protein-S-isoprenylcysteine O-methyltransferase Ste14
MSNQSSDSPAVIAFPPLLYGGAMAVGLILHALVPIGRFPALPARLAGAVVLVSGGMLAKRAKDSMRRAGTNIRPDQPTTTVVTDGPFRFSRNPLYVATTGLYVGVSLLVDAVWPLVLLVPLLIVVQWGVIRREERYLEAKFGAVYLAYKARVRRWL